MQELQEIPFLSNKSNFRFNPIQNRLFRGCSQVAWGVGKKTPSLNLPHISHNDETWHSYILRKEDPKNIFHVTHPLSSANVSIFSPEISNFCYIKKFRYRLQFDT